MKNTVLSACLAALTLTACDAGASRRAPAAYVSVWAQPQASLPAGAAPEESSVKPHSAPAPEDLLPAEPEDALSLVHEAHLSPVDHLARARTLREAGDLAGALTEARRAVHDAASEPDATAEALDVLITLARLTDQKSLAVEAYGELALLFPDGSEPRMRQARLLLEMGEVEGALHAAEAALEIDPEDPEVYQVLGRALLASGQWGEAAVRFQQVLHLDPYHGYALNNLGLAWLHTGQDAQAAEALAQAAYLLPHEGFVHNNLGLAYERLGRLPEARMAFDTAARLSPGNARARLNRNRLERLERVAQATADVHTFPGERSLSEKPR